MNGYLVVARTSLFDIPVYFANREDTARIYAKCNLTPQDVSAIYQRVFSEDLDADSTICIGYIEFRQGSPVKWIPVSNFEGVAT